MPFAGYVSGVLSVNLSVCPSPFSLVADGVGHSLRLSSQGQESPPAARHTHTSVVAKHTNEKVLELHQREDGSYPLFSDCLGSLLKVGIADRSVEV